MTGPLVSVIVPVYNVEKYLEQCVDSVLNQTYRNLEIILVDDGSQDSSREICDTYINVDSRVKVIHQENGGSSSARNAGLVCASGAYVFFLDSDDWLAYNAIEIMLLKALTNNAQMVICDIALIYESDYRKSKTCE